MPWHIKVYFIERKKMWLNLWFTTAELKSCFLLFPVVSYSCQCLIASFLPGFLVKLFRPTHHWNGKLGANLFCIVASYCWRVPWLFWKISQMPSRKGYLFFNVNFSKGLSFLSNPTGKNHDPFIPWNIHNLF